MTGIVSDDDSSNPSKRKRRRLDTDKRRSTKDSKSRDDSFGHYEGEKASIIDDRYRVLRQVGVGTFGKVLECVDLKRGDPPQNKLIGVRDGQKPFAAIKVIRKVKRYYDAARMEAQIIDAINRRGGRGLSHCVVLRDAFDFSGHYCLVFESLGPSLYDFLQRNNYRAFPMFCIQDFAIQLLEGLEFLHSFGLIHTDLKIENIILLTEKETNYQGHRVPESTRIKLIDFGGACYDDDKKSAIINTRQYRAPEVILGVGWSMPSDMWSLGCILAELYLGDLLFPTHNNEEHLALMERVIDFFPHRMIDAAKYDGSQQSMSKRIFDSNSCHRMGKVLSSDELSFVKRSKPLRRLVGDPKDRWFLDLISRQLVLDPSRRSTAHECLRFLASIRRNFTRLSK